MPNTLQIKRGLQASLPTGAIGEPLFTTDTKRLYISDGTATNLLQGASTLLTTGAIPFSDANGKLTMSASNLYWDNTNNRLGIGTSSPAVSLSIFGTIRATNPATLSAYPQIYTSAGNFPIFEGYGNGITLQTVSSYSTANGAIRIYPQANSPVILGTTSGNNNTLIGTTTDAGYKLDVNGTARVSGNTTITGEIYATNFGYGNGQGNVKGFITQGVLSGVKNNFLDINNYTATTGNITHILVDNTGFNPTGGSGTYSGLVMTPKINQTGGANGITRGLYINPTLTAAADFRAIETTAGNVLFGAAGTGFYWDNTNNRLGVGTSSPQTTAHIQGNLTIGNPSTLWRIIADVTSGSNPGGYLNWTFNDNFTYYRQYNQSGFHNYETTAASGYGHRFLSQGTISLSIRSNGNVLIGTTTDAGYKLDVNGTAQISGNINLSTAGQFIGRGINDAIRFNTAEVRVSVSTTTGNFSVYAPSFGLTTFRSLANGTCLINTTAENASAVLQADSTTKGFLPPRGTNAQMLAIASPATGLIFYDITNNKLNCYDGTTWQPCW